jgi:hypothetical protein
VLSIRLPARSFRWNRHQASPLKSRLMGVLSVIDERGYASPPDRSHALHLPRAAMGLETANHNQAYQCSVRTK